MEHKDTSEIELDIVIGELETDTSSDQTVAATTCVLVYCLPW